jgi:hypothetical protein
MKRDTANARPAPATRDDGTAVAKRAERSSIEEEPDGRPERAEFIRRADRLFREGLWREAAAAYKRLVQLYPDHPDLALWKRRLSDAERAVHN